MLEHSIAGSSHYQPSCSTQKAGETRKSRWDFSPGLVKKFLFKHWKSHCLEASNSLYRLLSTSWNPRFYLDLSLADYECLLGGYIYCRSCCVVMLIGSSIRHPPHTRAAVPKESPTTGLWPDCPWQKWPPCRKRSGFTRWTCFHLTQLQLGTYKQNTSLQDSESLQICQIWWSLNVHELGQSCSQYH